MHRKIFVGGKLSHPRVRASPWHRCEGAREVFEVLFLERPDDPDIQHVSGSFSNSVR